MLSPQLLVAIANGGFVLVLGTVGVRLLALARRTRQLPELTLGIGFSCAVVGMLLLAISGVGRVPAGEVRLAIAGLGFVVLWMAFTGYVAFTWRTFRPAELWAAAIVASLSGIFACGVFGAWQALATASASASSSEVVRLWVAGVRIPLVLTSFWTASESLRQYSMERRRLALDIGNPFVANRFLLWAGYGGFTFLNGSMAVALQVQGIGPMNHPLGAAALALGGLGPAVLVSLAFMPPAAYRSFVARRAGLTEA
jgi:hypothetical protein